ncbi:MAG: hypothetical protein KC877_03380 [Candidatus Kaiserbacteria bacterium]|nr:hypothetical protein [Candidatus Kaiserbacteria bacterium]MCB9815875.1 hypothetical protein [Candidatus Nomurabacteria bacterium]
MKKFLIISGSFLLGALVATVLVFWYVLQNIPQPAAGSAQTNETTSADTEGVASSDATTGIPLRDLALSDAQLSVLDKVGIDVDTFVITPAMQSCAAETLGSARFSEVLGGAAPSVLETTRLLPCLRAE